MWDDQQAKEQLQVGHAGSGPQGQVLHADRPSRGAEHHPRHADPSAARKNLHALSMKGCPGSRAARIFFSLFFGRFRALGFGEARQGSRGWLGHLEYHFCFFFSARSCTGTGSLATYPFVAPPACSPGADATGYTIFIRCGPLIYKEVRGRYLLATTIGHKSRPVPGRADLAAGRAGRCARYGR